MAKVLPLSLLLLLLVFVGECNVWDNVYSQTNARTPIVLEESINLDFTVPQYNLKGNIDFNQELSFLTLSLYFDLGIMKIEVLKAQLDLKTLTLATVQTGKTGCQRYQL